MKKLCNTCEHWDSSGDELEPGDGYCDLLSKYESPVYGLADNNMIASDVIVTGPEFGCILWEKNHV